MVGSDGKTRWIHRNDAASWDVNVTRSAPACNAVKDTCENCCQRRAVHGGLAYALRRHMQQPNAHVRITVVGNSVARFNDFGVARGLIAELMKRFPKLRVSVEYANVAGGFEPDHLYYCGLTSKSLLDADLILVHYHAPRGGMVYEKILRRLLQLPHEPAIVYVAHCTMADFSAYRDWALMRDRGPRGLRSETEGQGYMEEVRRIEERLLKAYGISFVSTCTAFRTMLGSVDQSCQARLLDGSWGDSWQNWRVRMARRWLPQDVAYGVDPPRTDSLGTWNTSALLAPKTWTTQGGMAGMHHTSIINNTVHHHHRVHHTPSFSHVTDLAPRFFLPLTTAFWAAWIRTAGMPSFAPCARFSGGTSPAALFDITCSRDTRRECSAEQAAGRGTAMTTQRTSLSSVATSRRGLVQPRTPTGGLRSTMRALVQASRGCIRERWGRR